jgi:hypothetical protein
VLSQKNVGKNELVDEANLSTVDKKKTRGKSDNPQELLAMRCALNACEHKARLNKYDIYPAHQWDFNTTTMQLECPVLAELAWTVFKTKAPTSTVLVHEFYDRLQITQDNRLQKVVKQPFMIDDTVEPNLVEAPPGKSVSNASRLQLTMLCKFAPCISRLTFVSGKGWLTLPSTRMMRLLQSHISR